MLLASSHTLAISVRTALHIGGDDLLAGLALALALRSVRDRDVRGVGSRIRVEAQLEVEAQLAAHDHVLFATVVHVRVVAIDAVADVIARDDLPGLMFSTEERHVFARDGPMTFVRGPGRGLESAGAQIRRSEVKHREQTCR